MAYALALLSIALASVAQLSLKLGMSALPDWIQLAQFGNWATIEASALLWVMLGLACYGISMLVWIPVLARLPLSVAYPLLSLSYIIVYLVATRFDRWGELASDRRSAGIMLIVLGVLLVSRRGRGEER